MPYIKSSNVIVETTFQEQLHLCLPSIDSITIRGSEKSASQNKLNNLNKLSAKIRIFKHITSFVCLNKASFHLQ